MRRRCCGTRRFRDWLFRTVVDTQNDYQLDDEKDKTCQYQISHFATVASGASNSGLQIESITQRVRASISIVRGSSGMLSDSHTLRIRSGGVA